jgi:drug/metabolite transporter (DMT)-like permease
MKLVRLIDFLRDHLKTVVWICLGFLALLIVIDALPFIVDKHHAHTQIEKIPGFWAVFGFVACVLIVILSKAYGHMKVGKHTEIMTREDYYND